MTAAPDRETARWHVQLITGSAETPCTFQVFKDSLPRDNWKARIIHGSLAVCWDQLTAASTDGCGVFITVNETDLAGREAKNIIRVRALFIDGDGIAMPAFPIVPTFTAQRDPMHWHAYWLVSDGELTTFTSDQERLISYYNSDTKVKDLPRVMRLAGFAHQKDSAHQAVYCITLGSGKTYARAEVLAAHLLDDPEPAHDPEDLFHNVPDDQPEVEPIDNGEKTKVWDFIKGFESIITEHGNDGMMRVCRSLVTGFGLDDATAWKALNRWNNEVARPPWSMRELAGAMKTVRNTAGKIPVGCLWEHPVTEIPNEAEPGCLLVVSAADLVATHADYRPAIIDGLLREGETMNVIAAPKVGKSWLVLLMAFRIANGLEFLGRRCAKGNVLIIDNELHPETAAQRLRSVADALSLPLDGIHLVSLRGMLQDLPTLQGRLEKAAASIGAKVIVLDALYRLLPADTSENDNAGMMQLYNIIDRIAKATGAAVVCIHHSSKGNQGEKSVTDGGAGAGAMSRAADAHLLLREHEDAGQVVVDAVARSWPPPASVVIARPGLVWEVVQGADPQRIKGRKVKSGANTLTMEALTSEYLSQYPEAVATICARIKGSGLNVSRTTVEGMLGLVVGKGDAVCEIGRGGAKLYGRDGTPGGNSTTTAKVATYLRSHPQAAHAEVAAACGCSTKTVQRVVERDAA